MDDIEWYNWRNRIHYMDMAATGWQFSIGIFYREITGSLTTDELRDSLREQRKRYEKLLSE